MAQVMCWLGWLAGCVEVGETLKPQKREGEGKNQGRQTDCQSRRQKVTQHVQVARIDRRSDFVQQQRVETKGMMNR